MTRVALRTLAEKSTMKFGRYSDLTVRQIIQLKGLKGLRYLRWIYYSASNISFNEDLLNELGIHHEIRIKKPGKVQESEIAGYLSKVERTPQTEEMKKVALAQSWGEKKAKIRKQWGIQRSLNNKGRNQNRNHGN